MHKKDIRTAGKNLSEATKALIMLHGRGAPAEDILSLASHLTVDDYALIAPQATNFTWYPYSFLALPEQNEPWLTSALNLIGDIVYDVKNAGITPDNIYFTGFSQGACLTLEFVTRQAEKWGGIAAFTGGLIGDKIYSDNYNGNFKGTPIFVGSGNTDPHIPLERVYETTRILREMHASVKEKIYPNREHTILDDEIKEANTWVFKN